MASRRLLPLLSLAIAAASCRSESDDPRVRVADLEDRRVERPESWDVALTREGPEARARAARAIGRIRSPALATPLRRALDVESDERVKTEQLFAFGQIGDAEGLAPLLAHLGDREPALRAAAAEALGKLAVPSAAANLVARLADPAPEVRGASLLALARLVGRRSAAKGSGASPLELDAATVFLQSIDALLADLDPEVRWKAAYALAEIELPGRADLLRRAARSEDELVRFFAGGGLARLAATKEAAAEDLRPLLEDANPHLAAIAAGGLGRLHDPAMIAPLLESFRTRLEPAGFHVRRAALAAAVDTALAAKQLDPDVERALEEAWRDPARMVRGEAMRASVLLNGAPGLERTFGVLSSSADVHEKVAAVRAIGAAPAASAKQAAELLVDVAEDVDPYVASEALGALAEIAGRAAGGAEVPRAPLHEVALARAGSSDLAVAASALELLKIVGAKEDLPAVGAALDRLRGFDDAEARATAVHVAAALAGKEAEALLRRARADESPAVVAAARDEWKKLGFAEDAPKLRALEGRPGGDVDDGGPISTYGLGPGIDFLSKAENPRIALHFEMGAMGKRGREGVVVIELLREEAPRHVKMVLDRVRAGRCDGLPIHRVVTGFVVQGLDPRGDGWGSGGVFLRDEINRVPYLRGAVGMPNAGPDSGGCQLFVTVVPTPHLDGRYTVFGWVVGGMEFVDALDVGDLCTRAEVIR